MTTVYEQPTSERPTRARRVGVELFHGAILTTSVIAVLFRMFQYADPITIANAADVRFGTIAVLIFSGSWLATDQAKRYGPWLAMLDVIEALLIAEYFNLLGLVPNTPREGMPNPGWAFVALAVSVLVVQMLWRRVAHLEICAEHWDYRCVVLAATGGACAARGWLQLVLLGVAASLVIGYIRGGHNTPPNREGPLPNPIPQGGQR